MSISPQPSNRNEPTAATPSRCRCVGVLGRLLGHKFKHADAHRVYTVDSCLRCGMPKGGWPK